MAHVKAEVLDLVCCQGLMYPLVNHCDKGQDETNHYCIKRVDDFYAVGVYCEHSKLAPTFIERTYKRFEATEHDPTWDHLFGCWDLDVGKTTYICSYLEIDGHIYCDERGNLYGMDDPRIKED